MHAGTQAGVGGGLGGLMGNNSKSTDKTIRAPFPKEKPLRPEPYKMGGQRGYLIGKPAQGKSRSPWNQGSKTVRRWHKKAGRETPQFRRKQHYGNKGKQEEVDERNWEGKGLEVQIKPNTWNKA